MEWIIWNATPDSESPVKATDEVCVRFHGEPEIVAIKRGFWKNCDELVWSSGFGDGEIVAYLVKA